MDTPSSMVWWEQYRPTKLSQLALQPEHRNLLEACITAGEIPHLLLVGPPGTGKTTVAMILTDTLQCDVLKLNASKDRGIDMIRDRVGTFAKSMGITKWKIVFMDEGDGLTSDAQNSLRNMMEDYNDQTRFIITANYGHKIVSPIQSRCTIVELNETPIGERFLILRRIIDTEGAKAEDAVVLDYANKFSDLRRMIKTAQQSVISNNGTLMLHTEAVYLGPDLLKMVIRKDWDGLVKLSTNANFDTQKALREMFWAVSDVPEVPKPAQFRYVLGLKGVHESGWTPDPVVHFLGVCSELILLA